MSADSTTPIARSVAAEKAAERLLAARVSIREAFEGLELGWTLEDVQLYLEGTPELTGQRLPLWERLPEHLRGQVVGVVMGFAIVAVEQDRGEASANPTETFPAPREDDCRYGCCRAGDEGICSELVRDNPRLDRQPPPFEIEDIDAGVGCAPLVLLAVVVALAGLWGKR
jgi:hypothetical protein